MFQNYLEVAPWHIRENTFDPENHEKSESIFSIGNGQMGQRANFEESYSGPSLQGSYVAGVYYPDKTRVGWWKNGYPEYFAKVLNSCNWIGLRVVIDGEELDLAKHKVLSFSRTLDMKRGLLQRQCIVQLSDGKKEVELVAERFCNLAEPDLGAISYAIKPINFSGGIKITSYLDFDVQNRDSNYGETFWVPLGAMVGEHSGVVAAATKKTDFHVAVAMRNLWLCNGFDFETHAEGTIDKMGAGNVYAFPLEQGKTYTLHKHCAVLSSMNHPKAALMQLAQDRVAMAADAGFESLRAAHVAAWAEKWKHSDIEIEGDAAAQQGIRFNIFQLHQTYTGEDERLNIGPKGFTGEKYGGSTYWDTEAYCLPFYLATEAPRVARNLLQYRYKHLPKAIENAEKLGFSNGAALYPMVTMNGEECHNEWEITFEEIHRNGAIAYAIYNYIRHTEDEAYLLEGGLDVLIGISRFWAQRVNWSEAKQKWVMLGVTGPNEYENNVNNNWYTNYIAAWTLRFTRESIATAQRIDANKTTALLTNLQFDAAKELDHWAAIVENIYYPIAEDLGIVLQQEGFLDKPQQLASDLPLNERPINQHWSWDRILRSVFIKQADVLQGFFFFEDDFTLDEIERNFNYYEPRTVHESSLSPCVHVVLAARLGKIEKAYELYLRTSRLDLDDYNKEVAEGLHITSMAGTWMSVVQGFGGMRIINNQLHFNPMLPKQWSALKFQVRWRKALLLVSLSADAVAVENLTSEKITCFVNGKPLTV